jgi:hypothetical protein
MVGNLYGKDTECMMSYTQEFYSVLSLWALGVKKCHAANSDLRR